MTRPESLAALVVRLRAQAAKATPGPWRWSSEFASRQGDPAPSLLAGAGFGILSCDGEANGPRQDDAAYLAALDPATVCRLLDAVEATLTTEAVEAQALDDMATGRGE